MGKVEAIENQVKDLTPSELERFREWFTHFDADAWDRRLEADVKAGKLDALAQDALREHSHGRSRPL